MARTEAEVRLAFDRYESALVAHDAATANELFWDSPTTVRFGIADAQTGHAEVARWRCLQPPLPPGRTLSGTRVAVLAEDVAVVTTLFRYPDRAVLGRQTQVWLRIPDGWRIASAHVSEIADG